MSPMGGPVGPRRGGGWLCRGGLLSLDPPGAASTVPPCPLAGADLRLGLCLGPGRGLFPPLGGCRDPLPGANQGFLFGRGHGSSKFNGTGGSSWHHSASQPPLNDTETARRCANEEGFDAITLDERGNMLFFKGDVVWKGFSGPAEPLNASWPQIQGPLDAALRIHHLDQPAAHDNVYFFQGQWVWAYAQGKLRPGFPRRIEEEFRGVPGHLDAAVECHPKECAAATVLFFKGPLVLSYDLATGMVKQRSWSAVANCSSAVRWLERYYCFQGIQFLRFDPVTGEVPPKYPRDARDYFMRCPGRGHGHEAQANATLRAAMDPCSGEPFQAFSSDDSGRIYAFRGEQAGTPWHYRGGQQGAHWHWKRAEEGAGPGLEGSSSTLVARGGWRPSTGTQRVAGCPPTPGSWRHEAPLHFPSWQGGSISAWTPGAMAGMPGLSATPGRAWRGTWTRPSAGRTNST
ncbi:Hemopexin [Podarcis lilfordi]|uniref:Hemopexin n=1 Tax=Podarcis lilfordi TaxID=74358 RepID=A0AA35K8K8_9SAUR|nr:Hemopexin [Podarcis lilfordi]